MNNSLIKIQIPKAVLYLSAEEIYNGISKELKVLGLRRGKAFRRSGQLKKRQAKFRNDSVVDYLNFHSQGQ